MIIQYSAEQLKCEQFGNIIFKSVLLKVLESPWPNHLVDTKLP